MEYPPKPIILPSQNSLVKTAVSMIAFLAIYYFMFDQDIKSAITVVIVLLIHEGGHFLAMKHYNYKDVQMMFVPFMGAFVSGDRDKVSQKENTVVILAGPVPGIILGLLFFILEIVFESSELRSIANIFVLLNAFNLLPVTPLDGGRLIEVLFVGAKEIVQAIFIILSMGIIVFLAWKLESYFLLILVVFLAIRLIGLFKRKQVRQILVQKNIDYSSSYSDLSDKGYYLIREEVVNKTPQLKSKPYDSETIINSVKDVLQEYVKPNVSKVAKFGIVLLWIFCLVIVPVIFLLFKIFEESQM